MVRSLYSGVAGMTSHQTKMDVIGNNISNVSTYGYKASRATFRDVYYQTTNAATSATAIRGGTNAAQVGYGTALGSIDVNHAQSIMTTTGYSLDVAITGEGYLQVQDPEGNIFYTKAGMLDIDASGNLVDINGNFVLGVSGTTTGRLPSSEKIKINLPYQNPSVSKVLESINDVGIEIASSNQSSLSNVAIAFALSSELPLNQKAQAVVSSSAITIKLNEFESFSSVQELNNVINAAIKSANSGVEHPAGEFTISFDKDIFADGDLKASQLVGTNFGVDVGSVTLSPSASTEGTEMSVTNYFSIKEVGDEFSASGSNTITFTKHDTLPDVYVLSIGDYEAELTTEQMSSSGLVLLTKNPSTSDADSINPSTSDADSINPSTSDADSITVTFPKLTKLPTSVIGGTALTGTADFVASAPSRDVGLGAATFVLEGGTEGGQQTVADLTSIAIGKDGVITGIHPVYGEMELGRIDLATFANPKGLVQVGNTYFAESANSGEPELAIPGTNGTGNLASGALETANVDLSNEFSNMITTQRGFQANSRIITVSDSMLEELINLKR